MLVMKFGGTSLSGAARIREAARLVRRETGPLVVVASAMGGVTDKLIALAECAQRCDKAGAEALLSELRLLHLGAAETVAGGAVSRETLDAALRQLLVDLEQLLHGVSLLRELSKRSLDLIMSFGERLAAPLLAAAISAAGKPGAAVDAREIVRTNDAFGAAEVDLEASRALTRERLLPLVSESVPVVTGFIGATADGLTTTLGRGGSDYSASLIGAFLEAREIWIWTDVDGVMTADPRLVPEARILEQISYREAAEMAYFGSKVLHPRTMIPAMNQGIPIRTRNSFNPDHPGTLITGQRTAAFDGVKTVTSIKSLALITIEGKGMMGVPGVARRVFTTTAEQNVNVYMISQSSSEQNISFIVSAPEGPRAVAALEAAFELERTRGQIEKVDLLAPVGILAIIGEGMKGTPGVSRRLFTALGKAHINVIAIAQGSSELNVSVVVEEADLSRAVGAVHTGFGLTRDVHLLIMGKGSVGRTLIKQILAGKARLQKRGVGLKVIGVCGRTELLMNARGLDDERLQRIAAGESLTSLGGLPRPDDAELLKRAADARWLDVVIVDATADETGPLHLEALKKGFHVVTANKKPLSGSLGLYKAIRAEAQARGLGYQFETTFGAGLPVLHTLQELIATRDEIRRVMGCFSGTLGFICSELERGRPFSAAVKEARERGYTEPDPRDDLSGRDVARKALIIARELGIALEMSDLRLEGMAGAAQMEAADVEAFLEGLKALDASFAARQAEAEARGEVFRYVAEITPQGAVVGLRAVPKASPIGQLDGPDNILVYETDRYREHPLVIRGPGAGAEVTAAGVFGDILKVARMG